METNSIYSVIIDRGMVIQAAFTLTSVNDLCNFIDKLANLSYKNPKNLQTILSNFFPMKISKNLLKISVGILKSQKSRALFFD